MNARISSQTHGNAGCSAFAGPEPAFQPNADAYRGAAVTDTGSLPAALLAKLDSLRLAGKP